ncbi:hypothetical protein QJS10_CPB18g00727 [Acorus calamus]|uniref:Uncharacterized protein n=1 Tax=Acorus calamus TaxID=4465 RepID=A0AAV9CL18_ACOCL|nr:hypothetical protein QJS10_CPB18g00727 [Acorus calamus]
MSAPGKSCPANSFSYNTSLCACNPGYYNASGGACTLFEGGWDDWQVRSGVDDPPTFLSTVLSFDTIRRFTQSQAVFLEATLFAVVSWLVFCLVIRFLRIDDEGRSVWFRIRWWISRFDVCYATRHWLDDRQVVVKRKTELGGTFSVASLILFIGLFTALLYQVISKRSIEVNKLRAVNALDLLSFINDVDFNITVISSMSCSHLRGLNTLVIGSPGSIDHRVFPLSNYANYYCHNTSKGPTVNIKCSNCRFPRDNYYISWQFVDLPNDPATAVGFHFNLTTSAHNDKKYVNFVSGSLKSESNLTERPKTFRGADMNVLKINLFPRIYHKFHNLSLIQPLFHDFLPGSSFFGVRELKDSLQSSSDGLINMTLHVTFLSDYIVEIYNENISGPVVFLADVGGLCAICFTLFYLCLLQFEFRMKKLRNEDSVFRNIRSRRRAKRHWDKLRKYVIYTWGHSNVDGNNSISNKNDSIIRSSGIGSLHKKKQQYRRDTIELNKAPIIPTDKEFIPDRQQTESVASFECIQP